MSRALEYAKAIAAFVSLLVTALLGLYGPDGAIGQVLTLAGVLAGVVAVYQFPNRPTS